MPAGRVAGKAGYSNHYYNGKKKIYSKDSTSTEQNHEHHPLNYIKGYVLYGNKKRKKWNFVKDLLTLQCDKSKESRSYVGINEEIMWVSIGMGVTIVLLITIALCYIAREKCQKRQREFYVTA